MSNFVVSARKYRPARFDDVVGQEHVSKTLKNALQNDQLAHAFLFCGPRGVGKTTCARILAKVLNCQNVTEDHEPCNECSSCRSSNENSSFNITELDAASNNSVEHIRTLIEQVRFQPQQGKYKVYIIDEVHMLSQQAFNAFLKTLEEPPPYAIFILATTEKHKIIPTILSRCQIFDFKRIRIAAIVEHIQGICESEDIKADKDALHIIAQKADGALRDALSIFDRIVAFSGKRISYEDVLSNLNVLDYDYYFKIVDALLVEDVSEILLVFDDILKKGFDPGIFVNGLSEHLRNLLVCKDADTLQLLELSEGLKARYQKQAEITPSTFILTALNIANDCDINFKMARNKRLHVEMALIKMTFINRIAQLANETTAALPEKKRPESTEPGLESVEMKSTTNGASIEADITGGEEVLEKTPTKVATSGEILEETPTEAKAGGQALEEVKVSTVAEISRSYSLPKLKALDTLVAEIKKEEGDKLPSVEDVTIDKLEEAWQKYIEESTQKSIQNLMKTAELELENNHVIATVGTVLAENGLRQESALMDFLRQELLAPNLTLAIKIDKRKAPEPPKQKKKLTSKEKYNIFRELNPLVHEIRKRFDLRLDEE